MRHLHLRFAPIALIALAACISAVTLPNPVAASDRPYTLSRRRTVDELIESSQELALRGDIPKALALLQEADILESLWGVNASAWNAVCWYGSLWGYAADVLDACDRAVELEPDNIEILDSRALARALTGNIDGAIADFTKFVQDTTDDDRRYQRQNWLQMLEAGENPFTDEVIRMLFID